jgi:hypothetical protein
VARHSRLPVYLEVGPKRAFAGSVEWPGWERAGRDTSAALQALLDYAPRYRGAVGRTGGLLPSPRGIEDLDVVERLPGDSSTDFGVPGTPPKADTRPLDDSELTRLLKLLRASWRTLDRAADAARGKALTKGPRGGGRELDEIVRHVLNSDAGYLHALGEKFPSEGHLDRREAPVLRAAVLAALRRAPREGTAPSGPRGGKRWTVRYFIRRSAWHALDHAWEIEDRSRE